ncbi:MAG: TAXI family TRAP transporter solute-binding subunit [Syntrophomonadaceae bacterium]|jgi:TRAP transporter TAXI family solute receptor
MISVKTKPNKLVLILLTLLLALTLSGCGSAGDSGGSSSDTEKPQADNGSETPTPAGEKTNFVFLSGPTGTTWYSQASALPNIVSKEYGWTVDVRPGSAISNIIMLDQKKADLGLTFSCFLSAMVDGKIVAVQGDNEYFREPVTSVRQLFNTTSAGYYLLVDAKSKYHNISDLKGEPIRYVTYPAGFTAKYVPEYMLQAHGVPVEDMEKAGGKIITVSKYQEALDLLAKGQADCIGMTGPTNSAQAGLSELESQREFRILELDEEVIPEILKEIPLSVITIPAGLQKSIKKDTVVLADITIWLCHKDMPEETAEKLCDAILKNMDTMAEIANSEFQGFGAKELSRMAGIGNQPPYHPGAVKFFAKHGVEVK